MMKTHPKILVAKEREENDRKSHALVKHGSLPWLARLESATKALGEIRDAASAKHVMAMAIAAESYARVCKLGDDSEQYARGIRYGAEIKLGEILKATPKATGTRLVGGDAKSASARSGGTVEEPPDQPPTLANLGISKKLSSEAQQLAGLSDDAKRALSRGEIKPSVALRDLKRSTLSDRVAALPAGKFRVLYADPPWKYGDDRAGLEKEGTAAAAQYPTMPTSQICDLSADGRHVSDLAHKDAVLFLWATFPLLEDGLAVMKAWQFDYKTAFVWDKQRSNIGNYHDARAEILLIGIRGSCPIEIDTRPKQVQSIARGKHSAKPEEWRHLIDQLYPTGPRVELFGRRDVPAPWKVWGNEAPTQEKIA